MLKLKFAVPVLAVMFAFVAFAPLAPAQAADDAAVTQIQKFYDTLLDNMKNAKALGIKGRYAKLEPVIKAVFALPKMTSIVVGPDWDKLSDAQKTALTKAFTRMTIANYAKNFDGYGGEKFVVEPKSKEHKTDRIVMSTMIIPGRDNVPFNYRMRQIDGTWQVIDIFLNGYVSEMATRRADFSATLKADGADGLVKKINTLTDKLLAD
jgi:phospholipid transport system substrate-binding protein